VALAKQPQEFSALECKCALFSLDYDYRAFQIEGTQEFLALECKHALFSLDYDYGAFQIEGRVDEMC
jgi:hypothetical protein